MTTNVSFTVHEKPPYKQTPASSSERRNQAQRKEACQQEARTAFSSKSVLTGSCRVSICYWRCLGMADSGNIVGGILDAMNDIVYRDDMQVVEISYIEHRATGNDRYEVTVTEVV